MFQFLDDIKFCVMNATELWIFLKKYPSILVITYTKMISTLCSIQLYKT